MNEVELHFVFIVPQPFSPSIIALLGTACLCSPVYSIVLLGKPTSDLRCTFEEPAVPPACLCSQKKQVQRAGKRGQGSSAFGMDPLLPLTLALRKVEARGCAYSPLTTTPSLSAPPCAWGLTSGDHIATTSLFCFQVDLAAS